VIAQKGAAEILRHVGDDGRRRRLVKKTRSHPGRAIPEAMPVEHLGPFWRRFVIQGRLKREVALFSIVD
jgi:hypothetical protein